MRAALDHYNAAVQADPNYDRAWYELGFVYLRQNQLDGAQKAFENVIRLNPDDYQAQGSLGMIYMQKGDAAHAEACLRAALKINPNDSLARENLERVMKASKR